MNRESFFIEILFGCSVLFILFIMFSLGEIYGETRTLKMLQIDRSDLEIIYVTKCKKAE